MIDKLRLGWTIFYGSRISHWKRLERIPVSQWLTRWSGRRTYEKFWRPLLRAKLGDNYRRTSAAFIWAVIQRLYKARRTGLKREMFGYVPGGYARVLERFGDVVRELGVDLRVNSSVAGAGIKDGKPSVSLVDGSAHQFDRLVVTAPAPVAARLLGDLTSQEVSSLESIEYQGIVCASVLLEESLSPYYVTNITDGWVPFTGIIEMSALVDRNHFNGRSLVYLPRYLTGQDPFFTASDEEVEQVFLDGLGQMHGHFNREQVAAFRVSRAKYVMPLPTIGYSERVPPFETSLPGIYLVNSAQIVNGTLNVNETVGLAEKAMATLLNSATPEDSS
jgi:protoporphyrinogen oxidase